ncbi:TetR/AcrR family transcriptional regulator [Aromatoleum aromaticum]|uniref:TetR/AcrR family transcriptional regulator n=1 Tax=Aromatoleum aromaticum TaxID=551760 RepID=UPI00145989C3|nr:TetR/AcrR family transcriptional regulator [Aromatoleum aromaticum]NMG55187.1 TetR family transcriptional regulator [Aromatoleum aromaticum]
MAEAVRKVVVRLPRDRRAEEIEAAAREVFCELGFEASSTAEIAARAGVAEGTLYKHFQNKRALLFRVLETWYRSMLADFESHLAVIHGARNKIHYIVLRHLRSLKENADLARLSYHEVRHSGDYYQSKLYEFNREYTQVFIEACREGMRAGELRDDVPLGLLRDLVFGGVDHLISGYLFNGRELDVDVAATNLVALVFNGIGTPAQEPGVELLQRFEGLVERMESSLDGRAEGKR